MGTRRSTRMSTPPTGTHNSRSFPGLYLCQECDERTDTFEKMEIHLRRAHSSLVRSDVDFINMIAYCQVSPGGHKIASTSPIARTKEDDHLTVDELVNWTQTPPKKRVLKCKRCHESFHSQSDYTYHVQRKHQSKKPKKIRKTDMNFSRYYEFDDQKQKLPTCTICSKIFTCEATYQVHCDSKDHQAREEEIKRKSLKPLLECKLCKESFAGKRERSKHYKTSKHKQFKHAEQIGLRLAEGLPFADLLAEYNELSTSSCCTSETELSSPYSDTKPLDVEMTLEKRSVSERLVEYLRPVAHLKCPPRDYKCYMDDRPPTAAQLASLNFSSFKPSPTVKSEPFSGHSTYGFLQQVLGPIEA